jgi:hypothetical protein
MITRSRYKPLTRKQAWRGLRNAFKGIDFEEYPAKWLNCFGLCNAVNRLHCTGLISVKTHYQMEKDIRSQKPKYSERAYYWPIPDKEARIKAITKILRERRK